MEYKLETKDLTVIFSSLGAEMISVKYNGIERLWQNDNNTWSGHAPVLFPIAGKIKVKIDGITYPLLQHGFARRREFDLCYKKDNKISFKLEYDDETYKLYPYKFILYINYELNDNAIKITYIIKNIDDKKIYFSIGSHTSFKLEDTIDNYNIRFSEKEEIINGPQVLIYNDGERC